MSRKVRFGIIGVLLIAVVFAYSAYSKINDQVIGNNEENLEILIPNGSTFDDVEDILEAKGLIPDVKYFRLLAEKMNYKRDKMRAGRYILEPGMSTVDMIRHLRSGKQAPVNVILTMGRLPEDVAEDVAKFLSFSQTDLEELLNDTKYLAELGYTPETVMSVFIPNTYEMYWNASPKAFMQRMAKEHKRFWDANNRRTKAKKYNLSPAEVYTLASIVERETLQNGEKKRMAGVYLNRLRIGMLLQADPTSVFARKDFTATRVTDYHTKYDSPYNTYMYKGLPPGPISMASIPSIDAVLNAESHKYMYFCAKGDGSGFHNFAKTLAAHNKNAEVYRRNVRGRK